MTDRPREHAPDMLSLSAYLDGELDAAARRAMDAHLAACPACAARLAELQVLAEDFGRLAQDSLGFDLAGVIAGRLDALPKPRPDKPRRQAARWWGLLPASLGAAASLAIGVGMGSALIGGSGAAMPRVAAMSVFDTLPPGGLCLGPESCYSKGAMK